MRIGFFQFARGLLFCHFLADGNWDFQFHPVGQVRDQITAHSFKANEDSFLDHVFANICSCAHSSSSLGSSIQTTFCGSSTLVRSSCLVQSSWLRETDSSNSTLLLKSCTNHRLAHCRHSQAISVEWSLDSCISIFVLYSLDGFGQTTRSIHMNSNLVQFSSSCTISIAPSKQFNSFNQKSCALFLSICES